MPLEKNTDYGKITLSDRVIEDFIAQFCQGIDLYDRIWLAAKPNIKASFNKDDKIDLTFSVYVKFGQSIMKVCKELADRVAKFIIDRTGSSPASITINVSGVKSATLIKRNMDVLIEYGDDDTPKLIN